jgi:hypothetical protein
MERKAFLASTGLAALAASMSRAVFATPSANVSGNSFALASDGIAAAWSVDGGTLRMIALRDRLSGQPIGLPKELFVLLFADGTRVKCSDFSVAGAPRSVRVEGNPASSRYAGRVGETSIAVDLTHTATSARVTWRAVASDGAQYLRQELTLSAGAAPLAVRDVQLVQFPNLPDGLIVGSVDGSPAVSGRIFIAVEHPFAQGDGVYDSVNISLPRKVDVQPGVPLVATMVVGATQPGQLRRGFLTYLERERAHPYRTFLHYNSWYDIGYFTRYTQDECLSRIHTFGEELHQKRNVRLESFLFDDGWDDPNHLWQFNSSFPDGFAPLKAAAERYGARPGAWLSPWGGYGKPHEERIAAARAAGYELNSSGLALSGPKYYKLFHDVVMGFIENGGVNQFKIDGTGNDANVIAGSAFGNDFEAAIALIESMREAEPNIYVNLTTGTYPSPFWLQYCDSIWRGGYDHNFDGVGTHRQKWITYRDSDTYAGIVSQGPLYPLNSVMLHGIIYAQHAMHLNEDPEGDLRSEIHSYFGTGTQLQEMYITPALLSPQNWNDLAQAAKWSAANAGTLVDTHWVGGNPDRLDVYGWASWSPRKGILTLRNPSDRTQSIPIDVAHVFELPPDAPVKYTASSPFGEGDRARIELRAGKEHLFTLQPYEVVVLDAEPHA